MKLIPLVACLAGLPAAAPAQAGSYCTDLFVARGFAAPPPEITDAIASRIVVQALMPFSFDSKLLEEIFSEPFGPTPNGSTGSCSLPQLAALTQRHPLLSIDLLALPRLLHLSRREADIVISLERPTRGSVIVSKLADYTLHLYGQREYLVRRPLVTQREDLRHHAFISYVDDLLFTKELQFLDQLYPPERFAFRSTSITAQYEAVRAGAGLAVLPAFLADRDPVLARVLPAEARFTRTFWMSMPAESKHLARMQAVWAFLKETVVGEAKQLMPDGAGNVSRL